MVYFVMGNVDHVVLGSSPAAIHPGINVHPVEYQRQCGWIGMCAHAKWMPGRNSPQGAECVYCDVGAHFVRIRIRLSI